MERSQEQVETELLALRASRGDADALDQLLRRWQGPLWRYLRGLCHEDQTAWDLLQETCLSITRSIRRMRKNSSFPALAYRIARRRYADWVRSDRRKRQLVEVAAEQASAGTEGSNDELVMIREVVARLDDDDREIVTLFYMEGCSYQEIASALDVPLGTVKSRLHYAKERIRGAIERETT